MRFASDLQGAASILVPSEDTEGSHAESLGRQVKEAARVVGVTIRA
jgi:hypothetical protein